MTKVQLPDGCTGLDMANGRKYTAAKPGGTIEVSSADSRFIGTSFYGQSGIMTGSQTISLGTKAGRWCEPCRFLAQAWSVTCPRCGAETTPTDETSGDAE